MVRTNSDIIKIYNEWASEQQRLFSGETCPYFKISEKTVEKFSKEESGIWKEIRSLPPNLVAREVWGKILSTNRRKLKLTRADEFIESLEEELKIKFEPTSFDGRINPKDIRYTEKIHELSTLAGMLLKGKGMDVRRNHLRWYEENGFLTPVYEENEKRYYSIYQIYQLDILGEWKEESLEYPNPTILPIKGMGVVKARPYHWQEYLLDYKKDYLDFRTGMWQPMIRFLLDVRDLHTTFSLGASDYTAKKDKSRPIKWTQLSQDVFDSLTFNVGKESALKISKANPDIDEKAVLYWIEQLALRTLALSPMLQIADKYPAVRKLMKNSEKNLFTFPNYPYKVRFEIPLANHYLKVIEYLTFYLQCLRGKREATLEELFASFSGRKPGDERLCLICGSQFLPNKNRGGRPQLICKSPLCDSEQRKRREEKRRKEQRLLQTSS